MAEIDIACGGYQRRGASFHRRAQCGESLRMLDKFGPVAAAKFGKAPLLVAIPFA